MPFKPRRVQSFSRRERLALLTLIALLLIVEGIGYFSDFLFAPQRRDVQHLIIYDTVTVVQHTGKVANRPARDPEKNKYRTPTQKTSSRTFSDYGSSKPAKHEVFKVLLNETDTFAWEALPGIGPAFSRRILKYRSLLGGYASKEQLGEVYGIDTTGIWFDRVLEDDAPLDSLYLNRDTIARFWRHPYVSPSLAREWVRYRERVGAFKTTEEVRDGYLMTDSIFRKIVPYLSVQ